MKSTRLAVTLTVVALSANLASAQEENPFSAPQAAQAAAHADQVREVERVVASSQRAAQLAQAEARAIEARAPRAMSFSGVRKGSAGRALVIPKDPTDGKGLAEMAEDMNVMAHILDKAASEDRKSGRAMGIPVFGRASWGGAAPQNLFLEGTGALFFLNVNFPLQPASEKDAATEAKPKPVSEWDTAKKEMAGPQGGGADGLFAFGENFEHTWVWEGEASAPYEADKVEALKDDLIAALKNAANIRKLKPDETVTVVVTGASALAGARTVKGKAEDKAARSRQMELVVVEDHGTDRAPAPAKLVLRVKKSDADAFQNGKQDLNDFKRKVTVMIY